MTTTTIASIQVTAVSVPMTHPHKTASGTISACPLLLIDVTSACGATGHSILFTYTPGALKPTGDLVLALGELIRGKTAAPKDIFAFLNSKHRLLGTQGLVGMAIAGIDMALWDLLARRTHQTLTGLLGGSPKPIAAYGGIGFDGVIGSANAAEAFAKQGFTGVKAKIGYATAAEDLAVVQAMRAAVGEHVSIMVDYNQSLDPAEAIARLSVLSSEGLEWVEEPSLAHDYQSLAHIRANASMPIQAGENWWGTQDLQHALDAGATDLLMPDIMKIGGVSGWLNAAAMAEAKQLRVSNHLWPEISARMLECTPTAHWLEYADWWNPILKSPLHLENGYAQTGDAVGSGIEWHHDAVERYRV